MILQYFHIQCNINKFGLIGCLTVSLNINDIFNFVE